MEIKDQLIREFAKRVDDLKENFLQTVKIMIEEEGKKRGEFVEMANEELIEDKKKRSKSPINKKMKKLRKIKDVESENENEWVAEEKVEKNIDVDMKIEDVKVSEGKDVRKSDGIEKKDEEKQEKTMKKEEGSESGLGFSKKSNRSNQNSGKNDRPDDYNIKLSNKDQGKPQSESTSKNPESKEPAETAKILEERKEPLKTETKKDPEAKPSQKKLESDTKSLTKKPDLPLIPQKSSVAIENTSKSLKEALDELKSASFDRAVEILNTFTNFLEDSIDKTLENFASLSAGKILKTLKETEPSNELKEKYQAMLKLLGKKVSEKASEKKIDKWESLGKSLTDAQTRRNDSEILALINKVLDYLLEKINPGDMRNIDKVVGILENIRKDARNSEIRNRTSLVLGKFKEKVPSKPHIADRLKGFMSNIS
ncbi:hypothetical protein SteCoe_28821 [Stentor coeruleus]|uniref:Uncharacterized protein n=1 Tax=Stentor coeruleus TaxID=5963 RepID=A0A1R2B7E5_9CILI|nr:hypothetical protein SteCoe_28821 [Stentor coeruleus]